MTSFAFNTMIGQVTPIAITAVGWKFYIVFVRLAIPTLLTNLGPSLTLPYQVVCNFTNALFFWAIQPETAKRPLEEMNFLFTNAPIFVPTMNIKDYEQHDLENRVHEVERKASVGSLEQL